MKLDTKLDNLLKAINLVSLEGLSEVIVNTEDLILLRLEIKQLRTNIDALKIENKRLLADNIRVTADNVDFVIQGGKARLGDYIDENA